MYANKKVLEQKLKNVILQANIKRSNTLQGQTTNQKFNFSNERW